MTMKEYEEHGTVESGDYYGIPQVVTSYLRGNLPENSVTLRDFIRELEREIIHKALKICNGNRKNTAELLGVKYSTLTEKIKAMDIKVRKRVFFEHLYLDN